MIDFKADQFVRHRAMPVWGVGRVTASSPSYVSVRFVGAVADKQFQQAVAAEHLETIERSQVPQADQAATLPQSRRSSGKTKRGAKAK